MRKLRFIVEYKGTDFVGWQRQANGTSIQGVLEKALFQLTGETISIQAAGRTDAGVHALGQVVSFSTQSLLELKAFIHGTNSYLPRSIAVQSVEEVPETFSARFSAKGKWYRYQIWNATTRSPLREETFYHVRSPLQIAKMQEAALLLVGEHDFAAFRAADCERNTTIRTLYQVQITEMNFPFGKEVFIHVHGTAFLKNMVRIIAGTLIEVGKNRMSIEQVNALLSTGDRTKAGTTAPAHGLVLCQVDYLRQDFPNQQKSN